MSVSPRELVERAGLGLPYDDRKFVKRALMHLPWRMFVGRQVEFNRATAAAIADLAASVKRLEARVAEVSVANRESAAIAVREQLYETEGSLRRDLSALQIEIARITREPGRS